MSGQAGGLTIGLAEGRRTVCGQHGGVANGAEVRLPSGQPHVRAHRREGVTARLLCALVVGATLLGAVTSVSAAAAPTAAAHPPTAVTVVLPHGYAKSDRRWPVLYALNISCSACTSLVRRLGALPVISVVETAPRALDAYVTRADGRADPLAMYAESLVRWTDVHYRTIADRRHRAVMGVSAGGFGALLVAARNPDDFGWVAGLSAPSDLRADGDNQEPVFATSDAPTLTGVDLGAFGRPYIDDATWAENNAGDLAADLAATHVFFASGTGTPCAGEQPGPGVAIEAQVRRTQNAFASDLRAAGVHFTYVRKACGAHDGATFTWELAQWLRREPPFAATQTRAAGPSYQLQWARRFTVRGWKIDVDPARAVEPLTARCTHHRLTLRGTGRTTLTRAGRRVVADLGSPDTSAPTGPYPPPGMVTVPGVTVTTEATC